MIFAGETDEKNLVDLGFGYKFDFGLTVSAGAQNLFNSEYRAFPNTNALRSQFSWTTHIILQRTKPKNQYLRGRKEPLLKCLNHSNGSGTVGRSK